MAININKKQTSRQKTNRPGSALILTVVLTVMLAVIGAMFLISSRISRTDARAVQADKMLDSAVKTIIADIENKLVLDLLGPDDNPQAARLLARATGNPLDRANYNLNAFDTTSTDASNEPWDSGLTNPAKGQRDDPWLADLEPVDFFDYLGNPQYGFRNYTDLFDEFDPNDFISPVIIAREDSASHGAQADADGDGVADSRWIKLDGISDQNGKNVYAAIRIIDNCALLNLNTAYDLDPASDGRYLSSVDYEHILRGVDLGTPENLRDARDPDALSPSQQSYHNSVVMNMHTDTGTLSDNYTLFNISDELEMRNRFMLTSLTVARFETEDVMYNTFDLGRGQYGGGWATNLRSRRIFYQNASDLTLWQQRLDPFYFAAAPGDISDQYKYDRRHICTFYSYDRAYRRRTFPYANYLDAPDTDSTRDDAFIKNIFGSNFIEQKRPAILSAINSNTYTARRELLYLLYCLRAWYIDNGYNLEQSALRAAQYAANMLDYMDDSNPANEGPLFDTAFGSQLPENPTYIDREVIRQLILQVSANETASPIDIGPTPGATAYEFGIGLTDPDQCVFGFEKQPFITELYSYYEDKGGIPPVIVRHYAVEIANPYQNPAVSDIVMTDWKLKIGTYEYEFGSIDKKPGDTEFLAHAAVDSDTPTRIVLTSDAMIQSEAGITIDPNSYAFVPGNGLNPVQFPADADFVELLRPDPRGGTGDYIIVDRQPLPSLLTGTTGTHRSCQRDDNLWRFTDASKYITVESTPTLGSGNDPNLPSANGYELSVRDNYSMDIETIWELAQVLKEGSSSYGSGAGTALTQRIGTMTQGDLQLDWANDASLLDYIGFMDPLAGVLSGRININTAPKHVLIAAIPDNPKWNRYTLADAIIAARPYRSVAELLNVPGFDAILSDSDGLGSPLRGDFEERDWIAARLNNIFTVRSDVFTAYIQVKLGTDGPSRNVIAIIDRSNVKRPGDKCKILGLAPVPDPR